MGKWRVVRVRWEDRMRFRVCRKFDATASRAVRKISRPCLEQHLINLVLTVLVTC
jgi:hypothetical protein